MFPVVDLRRRFGLGKSAFARGTRFIVIGIRSRIVGLVVDAVREVLRIPRADIRATKAIDNHKRVTLFSGACRHKDGMVMVLDIEQVLSSDETITLRPEESP